LVYGNKTIINFNKTNSYGKFFFGDLLIGVIIYCNTCKITGFNRLSRNVKPDAGKRKP